MRQLLLVALAVAVLSTSCVKKCECPKDEPEQKTLTSQPGPDNGQDCLVHVRNGDGGLHASSNQNGNPDIFAGSWSYNGEGHEDGTARTYIKFPEVSTIPQNATIKSAKLSLWGVSTGVASPTGNSYYTGSPYNSYGDNKTWLKRVTADWTETTITWNNKPATTDVNQVALPASNSQWNFNVPDIDVTNLVKDMVSNGQNYGFCLQLQVEQIYRAITFYSSEMPDAAKRPKLVVEYEIP